MKHLGSPMLTDLFHVFSIYVMIMAFYNSGFGSVYMLVFGLFLIFISGSLFSPLTGIRLAKRVEMNVQPRFQSTMHPALKYMSFARPIFIFPMHHYVYGKHDVGGSTCLQSRFVAL